MTFIIPCWNEVEFTKKCVKSIVADPRCNFVFIDNGSTDETPKYLATIPNSTVISNKKNIYVNPAWNQGFKHVLEHDLGDYVCVCNNDVIVGRHSLDVIFDLFAKGRKEWYTPYSHFNNETDFRLYCSTLNDKPLSVIHVRNHFPGFCMFLRKEYIKLLYPIPEQLKVIRGDCWIIDSLTSNNIFCFNVSHCPVFHSVGITQRSMERTQNLHEVRERDNHEFDRLVATEYKKRNWTRGISDHDFGIGLL